MKLFLSPHNDDETLFGAFTLLREHPLVVIITDSYVQEKRDPTLTATRRRRETVDATIVLRCPVVFVGLRDDTLATDRIAEVLRDFYNFDEVYAPARQGGHLHHDMVHDAATAVFETGRSRPVTRYCTYSQNERSYVNTGGRAIIGTPDEWALKRAAMACYPSQVASKHHFEAVVGKPEWLTP